MMICITSQGPTLDSPVEERFGRAPYLLFIDTETGTNEVLENKFAGAAGGVGPKVAQLLVSRGVTTLVSGMVGGNGRDVLTAAGIRMYTYHGGGSVKDALRQVKDNTLESSGP